MWLLPNMHSAATWCLLAVLATAAGCSRQQTTTCESDVRYSAARSAPPVQVPDDLTPPSETDALRLPEVGSSSSVTAGGCLEAPPSFFGESRPFRTSADSEEGQSRRQRRDARRQARAEDAEQQDSAPPPPEEAEPAPAENDRVIDN